MQEKCNLVAQVFMRDVCVSNSSTRAFVKIAMVQYRYCMPIAKGSITPRPFLPFLVKLVLSCPNFVPVSISSQSHAISYNFVHFCSNYVPAVTKCYLAMSEKFI